jgi:hypothetical protein
MSEYKFREYTISSEMVASIRRYVDDKIPPGSFLSNVICDESLRRCIETADDENMANLPAFVAYFVNEVPGSCWGSRKKMEAWLNEK